MLTGVLTMMSLPDVIIACPPREPSTASVSSAVKSSTWRAYS